MDRPLVTTLRAGLLLITAASLLACLGGRPARRPAPEAGGGQAISSLREIYGGDGCGAPSKTGQFTWKVNAGGGGPWNVAVFIPEGAGPRRGVIALHGKGGTGAAFAKKSGWEEVARDNGAILVAPTAAEPPGMLGGAEALWNSGRNEDRAFARNDVEFLDAIATALKEDGCAKKILGTGFSDGGSMTMSWNCNSPRFPDAMVVGSSQMLLDPGSCVKQRPVPYRLYMGTEDPRYDGGMVGGKKTAGALPTAEIFAGFNGCGRNTGTRREAPKTECTTFQGCDAATELCVIQGMGHKWAVPPDADVNGAVDGYSFFLSSVP